MEAVLNVLAVWLKSLAWDSLIKSLLAALFALFGAGCAFIKPTTEIRVNPLNKTVEVYNTKDVDVAVKDLAMKWDDKSGEFAVAEMTVSDKASPVIVANVQQMLAFVEQQKAANEGIKIAMTSLADIVGKLIPFLNLTPDTAAAWLYQLKDIQGKINYMDKVTLELGKQADAIKAAATQPAK